MRRLIECVPNFSEGRDPARIDAIVAAMSGIAGCWILDRQSDFDHHRSVITLAGEPEAVAAAALRGVGKAAELIDITRHSGAHPRIGAIDVLPFVPVGGVTLEECAALAHRLGREIWERYAIPVYFYEAAALRPDRADLENVRRGQWERLREAARRDPVSAPDVGGPELHPTAGAVAVGARRFLIAYNIQLSTADATVAAKIARAIRFSSGGLRYVKAIGVELKMRGQAQVSINLTDFEQTPLHVVFEMARREAERHGCTIVASEIVGLAPRKALEMAAAYFLRLDPADPVPVFEDRLAQVIGDAEATAGIPIKEITS
jgi:glutamate formiminotransferase